LKADISPKPEVSQIITFVLLVIAAAIILLLITGTIFGLARSSKEPVLRLGRDRQAQTVRVQNEDQLNMADTRVFSGLGRLRIPLSNSSILILSIAFPYSASDVAFTEELASKINDLRGIASDYFSSLPAEKLTFINEEEAKTEILKRYNENLRLGRIEALYFNDMITLATD
jgi:flagellar basal body-associated protein FliL